MVKRWLPLESNPDVMADFAAKLGLDTAVASFHDVLGLDDELLLMVPQPVLAVLLIFPITKASQTAKKEEEERISQEGQEVSPKLYYMKQTIRNACGTIGLLHMILNNMDKVPVGAGSFLAEFHKATEDMDANERGKYLEEPPKGAPDIEEAHREAASAGDTAAPDIDEEVDLHFVCFVERDGCLYELDGSKARPINHGPATPSTLLKDSSKAVRAFIERADSNRFNIIVLAPAQ